MEGVTCTQMPREDISGERGVRKRTRARKAKAWEYGGPHLMHNSRVPREMRGEKVRGRRSKELRGVPSMSEVVRGIPSMSMEVRGTVSANKKERGKESGAKSGKAEMGTRQCVEMEEEGKGMGSWPKEGIPLE